MTNSDPSSSQEQSSVRPPKPLPTAATKSVGRLDSAKQPKSEGSGKKSESLIEYSGQRLVRRGLRSLFFNVQKRGCLRYPAGFLLLVLILVAAYFYIEGGQPLVQIDALPASSTQKSSRASPTVTGPSESTFVILGQYGGRIFTFNSVFDKIYAYDPQTSGERQIATVPEFETFLWHDSGKIALVSDAYSAQGNIYLLDLTQALTQPITSSLGSDLEPVLVTNREVTPNFPRDLQVDGSLPMAWSQDGETIAFTARDINSNEESLFLYDVAEEKLAYTTAQNLDRISSILWVADTLTFVAIDNGQEDRYSIERSGAGFAKWVIK
jgi:hypothetical protein